MAAKKKTTTKRAVDAPKAAPKAAPRSPRAARVPAAQRVAGTGGALVIVESPAKAKTIERYLAELGTFHVEASKGHIRDLPERAERAATTPKPRAKKGEAKIPAPPKPMDIPGVDMETFATTYVITPDRRDTVTTLKRLARNASDIWFATDLDREGEAISWHIAEVLDVDPNTAKRVVFNSITKSAIQEAFAHPRPINMPRVNAQNSRRILDRIVGYGISPLLWRLMRQGGLSAGRVQTVAARLVVEREQEIREFVPDESWEVLVRLTADQSQRGALTKAMSEFFARRDVNGKPPSQKDRLALLSRAGALEAKLVEIGGKPLEISAKAKSPTDLSNSVRIAVEAAGLEDVRLSTREDPRGRGAAKFVRTVQGNVGATVSYRVISIETVAKSRKALPPLKTSSLQMAASSELGSSTLGTMRVAQQLYEGVDLAGGRVGLITYMRTDSVYVAPEALHAAREHIERAYGKRYLPKTPNFFGASKDAQEAHEAIRPTDPARTPESVRNALTSEQYNLYELIWRRFVASQMAAKEYELTTVRFERSDKPTGAIVRASGSVIVFDGYLKLVEDLSQDEGDDEATFPKLEQKQVLAAVSVDGVQRFSAPPARYSEASLVKELESRGIGRPSTYASIINTVQARGYVEQKSRRFYASALGEAVVSLLIGGFPLLFDYEYTRNMEARLDKVENDEEDWRAILREIKTMLEGATLDQCFARMRDVPLWRWTKYACPTCGKRTKERVGGGRWFLSCSGYPECAFASRLNEDGEPVSDVALDMVCPVDGSAMVLRAGKFGKYISSVNYPEVKFVVRLDKKDYVVLPTAPPLQDPSIVCSKCGKICNIRNGKRGPWLGCSGFPKCRGRGDWKGLGEAKQQELIAAIAAHSVTNAPPSLRRRDRSIIDHPVLAVDLILPESVVTLPIHPDAAAELAGEVVTTDVGFISPFRAAERIAKTFLRELKHQAPTADA